MRIVVSTIGTPPYGNSKYLVKVIQPTLNKRQHKTKDSIESLNEAKSMENIPIEIQVPYDVVNLHPSVPLDKAIDTIVEYLKNDFNNVKRRAKLTLVDIHQLSELCLSGCSLIMLLYSKTWRKIHRFIFCF